MLREYAVEPDLVPTWLDRKTGRYFLNNFGLGTPRIISRYPRKHWKRLVWEAWRASNDDSENEHTRMEALIQRLSEEPLAKLPGDWGWAQSSALLVNTIALDRRLDILSGEPAARRR